MSIVKLHYVLSIFLCSFVFPNHVNGQTNSLSTGSLADDCTGNMIWTGNGNYFRNFTSDNTCFHGPWSKSNTTRMNAKFRIRNNLDITFSLRVWLLCNLEEAVNVTINSTNTYFSKKLQRESGTTCSPYKNLVTSGEDYSWLQDSGIACMQSYGDYLCYEDISTTIRMQKDAYFNVRVFVPTALSAYMSDECWGFSDPVLTTSTYAPTTKKPTKKPTNKPTTKSPTQQPTTKQPTQQPTTKVPTQYPSTRPTNAPTTKIPTKSPTKSPTKKPTLSPVPGVTIAPTRSPTKHPTNNPTKSPTVRPTIPPVIPTIQPTTSPITPTIQPTTSPSTIPSNTTAASQKLVTNAKNLSSVQVVLISLVVVLIVLIACIVAGMICAHLFVVEPAKQKYNSMLQILESNNNAAAIRAAQAEAISTDAVPTNVAVATDTLAQQPMESNEIQIDLLKKSSSDNPGETHIDEVDFNEQQEGFEIYNKKKNDAVNLQDGNDDDDVVKDMVNREADEGGGEGLQATGL